MNRAQNEQFVTRARSLGAVWNGTIMIQMMITPRTDGSQKTLKTVTWLGLGSKEIETFYFVFYSGFINELLIYVAVHPTRFRDWAESRDQQILTESGIEIYKDFEIRNPNLRQKSGISREKNIPCYDLDMNLFDIPVHFLSIEPLVSCHTICVGSLCYEGAMTTIVRKSNYLKSGLF